MSFPMHFVEYCLFNHKKVTISQIVPRLSIFLTNRWFCSTFMENSLVFPMGFCQISHQKQNCRIHILQFCAILCKILSGRQ